MNGLVIDNFAGGGGASEGIRRALGRDADIAVNHDAEAIAMHAANHPTTHHLCGDVWEYDPIAVTNGAPVELAWFSPTCIYFSRAKGGALDHEKATSIRALAWVVVRWAKSVRPRVILLENVAEFAGWTRLDNDGKPIARLKGETFRRWWRALEKAGYVVEMRELRACDFGAPTIRKRLFVIARCDGMPIVWPEPTHGPGRIPYATAASCIDWSIPVPSIFGRKRPLADKTLARIARGTFRFVIDSPAPFIVPLTHGRVNDSKPASVNEPLRTVTGANRGELAIVTPFIAPATHGDSASGPDQRSNAVDEPLRTIITRGAPFHLIAPTLVQTGYGEREGQAPRSLDLQQPIGTVVAGGQKHALVAAFLAKHYGGVTGQKLDQTIGTVTTWDHHSLVTANLERGSDHSADVRAFLTRFYGTGVGAPIQEPLFTITAGGWKHGLVLVHGETYAITDIGMRMLQPRELYRAQGFDDSYVIDRGADGRIFTKTTQIKLCGNSVCPPIAEALVRANVAQRLTEVA